MIGDSRFWFATYLPGAETSSDSGAAPDSPASFDQLDVTGVTTSSSTNLSKGPETSNASRVTIQLDRLSGPERGTRSVKSPSGSPKLTAIPAGANAVQRKAAELVARPRKWKLVVEASRVIVGHSVPVAREFKRLLPISSRKLRSKKSEVPDPAAQRSTSKFPNKRSRPNPGAPAAHS